MKVESQARRPFRRVQILPSLLTIGNFACGFVSIVICLNAVHAAARIDPAAAEAREAEVAAAAVAVDMISLTRRDIHLLSRGRFSSMLSWACVLIFVGMLFDALDGKLARHMGAASAFGTELDSLADVTTFGLAPPMLVNAVWISAMPPPTPWLGPVGIFGVVFSISAVLRLARYNIQCGTADKNTFTGLPSPAAAGCVAAALLLAGGGYGPVEAFAAWLAGLAGNGGTAVQAKAYVLGAFLLLPGLLMISTIPFAHLPNRCLSGKKSFSTLAALVLILALTWLEPRIMLFAGFNGYMLAGVALAVWRRRPRGGGGGGGLTT
ncbi:MAG: CDP-alcohol phosphatidyltransferase family protein [Planctomycetota bacterium]|jgi:CDP-diacylglycerol--serine O-phosphatidyltransferase|nr:CDP-alcohol phosphatidyltransferase family protein [Planctomycetota bacterium]